MKYYFLIVAIFLLNICTNAQPLKKGLIVQLNIEGTQQTDMGAYYNGTIAENFRYTITDATILALKRIFNLDTIEFANGTGIVLKPGLNKFVGVNKISKEFLNQAQNFDKVFKIKCDIAFNETTGGFLVDKSSSRAEVVLSVGVFNNQLQREKIYKGKAKDGVIFLGRNANRVQWLTREDFEQAYFSCLDELKPKE